MPGFSQMFTSLGMETKCWTQNAELSLSTATLGSVWKQKNNYPHLLPWVFTFVWLSPIGIVVTALSGRWHRAFVFESGKRRFGCGVLPAKQRPVLAGHKSRTKPRRMSLAELRPLATGRPIKHRSLQNFKAISRKFTKRLASVYLI